MEGTCLSEDFLFRTTGFFFATGIALTSMHYGLVRLIGSGSSSQVEAIDMERGGVLIVTEAFLLLALTGPLPFLYLVMGMDADAILWVTPFATLLFLIMDFQIAKSRLPKRDTYYWLVWSCFALIASMLLMSHISGYLDHKIQFILSLALPVLVIVSQLVKSVFRFYGYLGFVR